MSCLGSFLDFDSRRALQPKLRCSSPPVLLCLSSFRTGRGLVLVRVGCSLGTVLIAASESQLQ